MIPDRADRHVHVRYEPLWGHAHLAPLLAGWHHAEFGHLYERRAWNVEIAARELAAMAEPGSTDITWVAFAGEGRDADSVLGSVSLIASDDLPGFDHLTPWLASLFVTPRARRLGLGSALVDRVLAEAAALGHRYVHLFTAGQERFYLDRGWRRVAELEQRGHHATVMARATSARGARRAVSSRWCSDPDTDGAYSYLRVGGRPRHRARLAERILPGLWFAGEATSVAHPATMHGAWFSGARTADQVLDGTSGDVLVVGAGLAGLSAARRLAEAGRPVVVLEAGAGAGGRVAVDTSLGVELPLGAAWLHGDVGHPLASLVSSRPDEWGAGVHFVVGHGPLTGTEHELADQLHAAVDAAFDAAGPDGRADRVLATVLASHPHVPPAVREAVRAWVTVEVESLYAAPIDDFAPGVGREPYELPGGNHLITAGLGAAVEQLADGLDIRYGQPVRSLTHETHDGRGRWTTDRALGAATAIVTVPVTALRSGRIRFDPALPDDVGDALSHIGAGPVTKLFATYDSRWWPVDRGPIRIAGSEHLRVAVDVTEVAGMPTLCWFATGAGARAIEGMSEHDQCLLVDRVAHESGLTTWPP